MMFFVRRSLWQRTVGESSCNRCVFSSSISAAKVWMLGSQQSSAALWKVQKRNRVTVQKTKAKCGRVARAQFALLIRRVPHFWTFLRLHIVNAKTFVDTM